MDRTMKGEFLIHFVYKYQQSDIHLFILTVILFM